MILLLEEQSFRQPLDFIIHFQLHFVEYDTGNFTRYDLIELPLHLQELHRENHRPLRGFS